MRKPGNEMHLLQTNRLPMYQMHMRKKENNTFICAIGMATLMSVWTADCCCSKEFKKFMCNPNALQLIKQFARITDFKWLTLSQIDKKEMFYAFFLFHRLWFYIFRIR